jgi:hypothetical protein
MQYNFKVKTTLSPEELATVIGTIVEGLEATGAVTLAIDITLNTELPADKEASLTSAVSDMVTAKLGEPAVAELISKQH